MHGIVRGDEPISVLYFVGVASGCKIIYIYLSEPQIFIESGLRDIVKHPSHYRGIPGSIPGRSDYDFFFFCLYFFFLKKKIGVLRKKKGNEY